MCSESFSSFQPNDKMSVNNEGKRKKSSSKSSYQTLKEQNRIIQDEYRRSFIAAFNTIVVPDISVFHTHNCNLRRNEINPFFSCITSINEETNIRMAVGSHHLPRSDCGRTIFHRESVVSITIPPTFCILFYHNRTVHGGGISDCLNLRIFGMYGPKDRFGSTEGRNYLKEVHPCNDDCVHCRQLHRFKVANGGRLMPLLDNPKKKRIGDTLFDYTLKTHGFCILKIDDKISPFAISQAVFIGEDKAKGMKFNSLGQEEERGVHVIGQRGMIDVGKALSSEHVLQNGVKNYLKDFCNIARERTCSYLKQEFGNDYEEKGHTFLRSMGSLGNQKLHVDAKIDCNCYL